MSATAHRRLVTGLFTIAGAALLAGCGATDEAESSLDNALRGAQNAGGSTLARPRT